MTKALFPKYVNNSQNFIRKKKPSEKWAKILTDPRQRWQCIASNCKKKRYSTSLIIGEIQIKTTKRYHDKRKETEEEKEIIEGNE